MFVVDYQMCAVVVTKDYNKLGDYIFRRMQKENRMRRNTHAREYMTGLYLTSSDIQRYVNDYYEYGIDYTGDDNISADDMWDFSKEPVDQSTGNDGVVYWDRELGEKEY